MQDNSGTVDQADLPGYSRRGERVVSGNHQHAYTGGPAPFESADDLGPGRVLHTHDSQKLQPAVGIVHDSSPPTGDGQNPQRVTGHRVGDGKRLAGTVAINVAERNDRTRRALHKRNERVAVIVKCRHSLD